MTDPLAPHRSPGTWAQFPAPAERSRWRPPPASLRWGVTLLLIGLGPIARAAGLGAGASVVGGVAVGAAVAAASVGSRRLAWPPHPLAVAGALGGVTLATYSGGRVVGAWVVLGVLAAIGAVGFLAQDGGRRDLAGLGPILGTMVASAVLGYLHPDSPAPLGFAALSALLAGVAARWPHRALAADRLAGRLVDRAGAALRTGCFAVLAVPFVLLPWAIGRLVRWDTTWSPRNRGSRWVASAPDPQPSDRPWQPSAPRRTWPMRRRATRVAFRLGLVLVLITLALGWIRSSVSTPDAYLLDAPAMADQGYWPELARAQDQLRANMGFGSYAYEQPDVRSAHLNIVGGHRRTWSPPVGKGCRPPVVWMFGGSTTFGEGQRDEHTIPSELARVAWADGVAISVTNFGVLGDPHWVEVRRLEEALGRSTERPDLVVFYDGANEVITRISLNDQGQAARQTFVSYLDAGLFIQLDRFLRPVYRFMTESDALTIEPRPTVQLDAEEVAALASRQYLLSLASSRRLVADEGIETVWFNQPTTWSTSIPDDQLPYLGAPDRFGREVTAAYESTVPDDVVDLSGMFDGETDPIFYDTAHTNELGARRVAEAMWPELRAKVTDRCDEEAPCC